MKTFCILIVIALLSFGCETTHDESTSLNLNLDREEKIICKRLQREPIPLPEVTPYDSNTNERKTYLKGFREAWKLVASGKFLDESTAVSMPDGMDEYWKAGWNDGYKIAIIYWAQEVSKRSEEILQKTLPKNSSSP
jgi:hypothetical protein